MMTKHQENSLPVPTIKLSSDQTELDQSATLCSDKHLCAKNRLRTFDLAANIQTYSAAQQ